MPADHNRNGDGTHGPAPGRGGDSEGDASGAGGMVLAWVAVGPRLSWSGAGRRPVASSSGKGVWRSWRSPGPRCIRMMSPGRSPPGWVRRNPWLLNVASHNTVTYMPQAPMAWSVYWFSDP